MSTIIAKVVFGGDGGVGKTTLIRKYLTGEFIDTTKITIGVDFRLHQMSYEGKDITFSVWDLGGQEQFKQMGVFGNYFVGAIVAILMFDLTRAQSIAGLDAWFDFIDPNSKTDIILVGGKSDLPRDSLITSDVIDEIIKKFNAVRYIETSSLNGIGVDLVFNETARVTLEKIPNID